MRCNMKWKIWIGRSGELSTGVRKLICVWGMCEKGWLFDQALGRAVKRKGVWKDIGENWDEKGCLGKH